MIAINHCSRNMISGFIRHANRGNVFNCHGRQANYESIASFWGQCNPHQFHVTPWWVELLHSDRWVVRMFTQPCT